MSKRTLPLLYIHQPKEVETEADNQEFFYTRKIVVSQKKNKDMELKNEEESDEQDIVNDLEEKKEEFQYLNDVDEVMEKLTYVQSKPLGIEPKIEIELDDQKYIGVLEKIVEETVVLRTRTAPYQIECPLDQISSVKIISL